MKKNDIKEKVKRQIIQIDEEKCNGCGLCVPKCAEGALQIIDGKARLVSDLFCDGLGACIGHCPEDAISIEERKAESYDERKVMEENIIPKGINTIMAHLKHLFEHKEMEYLKEAIEALREKDIIINIHDITGEEENMEDHRHHFNGCPGSTMMDLRDEKRLQKKSISYGKRKSELRQWPIQMHLIQPIAPYFREADVLLVADCVGYALGDFHKDFLKNKCIVIACPKLDSNLDSYIQKLVRMIDEAKINTLTVMRMEVPCCSGLLSLAKEALRQAEREIPIKEIVVSIPGEILSDEWQ